MRDDAAEMKSAEDAQVVLTLGPWWGITGVAAVAGAAGMYTGIQFFRNELGVDPADDIVLSAVVGAFAAAVALAFYNWRALGIVTQQRDDNAALLVQEMTQNSIDED